GGVDDVDAGVLPLHRGRLGQNGDAALALQIVGIHRALDHALVVPVGAGLLQQAVDERGFAVVDVGDDGDVTKVHGSSSGRAMAVGRSRRKTGTHFSGSRSKPEMRKGQWPRPWPQKGSPAKRTGHTLRV